MSAIKQNCEKEEKKKFFHINMSSLTYVLLKYKSQWTAKEKPAGQLFSYQNGIKHPFYQQKKVFKILEELILFRVLRSYYQ